MTICDCCVVDPEHHDREEYDYQYCFHCEANCLQTDGISLHKPRNKEEKKEMKKRLDEYLKELKQKRKELGI
ncbi:MAG: hypothetical protein ACXAC2_00375 [Candidatus Kariarchaeaceae archaeon]|jgi:hypothetical protein